MEQKASAEAHRILSAAIVDDEWCTESAKEVRVCELGPHRAPQSPAPDTEARWLNETRERRGQQRSGEERVQMKPERETKAES